MSSNWINHPCQEPSDTFRTQATLRQQLLTKPPGSLGQLETLAIELAALQHTAHPSADPACVCIFAADHGVTAQNISAFPASVTAQMLANFAAGGAAIAVLAKQLQMPLHVYDVGSFAREPISGVITDKVCYGSADISQHAAMDAPALQQVFDVGRRATQSAQQEGACLLILGEMGIGNTTAATALACSLTGLQPNQLTGAGSGLDTDRQAHKQAIIEQVIALHQPSIDEASTPALEALRRVGGLEIAAMTGAIIAAAQAGIPVLIDGFIVTAAALAATCINPAVRAWLLFSHQSDEHGHVQLLAALNATPLVQLGMRLGEGSGAALAQPLLRLACALHNDMATFEEAAVANRQEAP